MATALSLLKQIIALAVSGWLLVFLYFTLDEYTTTKKMCITAESAVKTNKTFVDLWDWSKKTAKPSTLQGSYRVEPLTSTYATTAAWEPALPGSSTLGEFPEPPAANVDVDEDETADAETEAFEVEMRRLAVSDSMEQQHNSAMNEFEDVFGSRKAMYNVEVEDVDVVNWVGLRRPKYDSITFSQTSLSQQPSIAPENMPKSNSLVL